MEECVWSKEITTAKYIFKSNCGCSFIVPNVDFDPSSIDDCIYCKKPVSIIDHTLEQYHEGQTSIYDYI